MGWRGAAKAVFGSGGPPPARPSIPSTRDQEKAAAKKAKATAARTERVTAYKRRVARGGKGLDFDTKSWS